MPLRQRISEKGRRSRHPYARTAAGGRRDNHIGSIVGPRGKDLVCDIFTPHNASGLVRPIRNYSENRGIKRIEARCISQGNKLTSALCAAVLAAASREALADTALCAR